MIKIAPSILSADFAKLGQEIAAIAEAGADMLHIDVMDGKFVPNITIGPAVINSIRPHTKLPFDVHLMVDAPEHLFEAFVKAGSDIITIHYEAMQNPGQAIEQIKSLGVKAGISIMPSTAPNDLSKIINDVDLVLVMTVNPGFGGQSFMNDQLSKIKIIADMIKSSGKEIILSVDGGINKDTAAVAIQAGANMLVSGSYIFGQKNYKAAIESLREQNA